MQDLDETDYSFFHSSNQNNKCKINMETKSIKIEVPNGYEIDKENSSFENIIFKEVKKEITERVRSIADAIKELGEEDEAVMQLRLLESVKGLSSKIISEQKIVVFAKAINEGWIPDWNNGEFDKWFLWYYLNEVPRVGYSYDWSSGSCTSSRLCYKTKSLAEHANKCVGSEYIKYLTY